MPRSLVSRSLEPLIAVLWGIFLVWTVWLAVVWIAPVGASSLGLADDGPPPANADLRRAVLLLAQNADLVWLTLAVMNLHLLLSGAHGIRIARSWLGFSAGGALVLGILNARTGFLFGWLYFGSAFGTKLFSVPVGWLLLWAVLVIASREAVLWMRPRASHGLTAILVGVLVLVTILNVEWPARFVRGWWGWSSGGASGAPWYFWVSWLVWPGIMAFAMRERDVASAALARSAKPVILLAALNAITLVARLRHM